MAYYYKRTDELYHHGILGQKWGVRRFQNSDGSLTPAGKKRYNNSSNNVDSVTVENVDHYLNSLGYDTPEYTTESRKWYTIEDNRGKKLDVEVIIDGDYRSSNSKAQNVAKAAKTINDQFAKIESDIRKDASKSPEIKSHLDKNMKWVDPRIFYNTFGTRKDGNAHVSIDIDPNGIGSIWYDSGFVNNSYYVKDVDWKTGLFIKKHWSVIESGKF